MSVNHSEYEALVCELDRLIDEVGEDERHPLVSLMDALSARIVSYEDTFVQELNLNQP